MWAGDDTVKRVVEAAIIAALYVVLTAISTSFGLSYLSVQFRLSEVLTILPIVSPNAVVGLTIGCFIANLASPLGILDIIFGTLSTFIAAHLTRMLGRITICGIPLLAPLPPVVLGAVFVGIILAFCMPEGFSVYAFLSAAAGVGLGQVVVCYGLSLPLYLFLRKTRIFGRVLRL